MIHTVFGDGNFPDLLLISLAHKNVNFTVKYVGFLILFWILFVWLVFACIFVLFLLVLETHYALPKGNFWLCSMAVLGGPRWCWR